MRFLVDKAAEHLEKGFQYQREGNFKQARYNLLKASEFLFKAAEKSDPSLKQARIKQAKEALQHAQALEGMLRGSQEGVPIEGQFATDMTSLGIVTEKPDVALDDIAGLEEVKEQIRIRMIYPFTHPEQARQFGIRKGGGILLYGPPGTGKTMLAKAVATEVNAIFFTVKPSEIMSKWVGEAEQNISRLFFEARKHERSVIFIDEVEALIPKRSGSHSTVMQRVVPQILSEMEGFHKDKERRNALLFIGATNEPWALDEAVLRPGRFDEKIYISLPDFDARLQILYLHLKNAPLSSDMALEEIALMLEGYSGADIRHICEKACVIPFVEAVKDGHERDVEKRDLLTAMESVQPSVTPKTLQRFQDFARGR